MLRLRLTKRTGAIPWQGYPGDRNRFHPWGQVSAHPIITEDIRRVLYRGRALWPDLKNAKIFITDATGFFGIWLLETLLAANREFSLNCRVLGLSRDPDRFAGKARHLAHDPAVTWIAGDVRDFAFPKGPVTHIIHAATESSTTLNTDDPQAMFDVCVEGTRRVLALAKQKRPARMLFTSSGAVYGRQPPELSHIPEDFPGGPDPLDPRNAYAEGKRAAEHLCALACLAPPAGARLPISIARCFAFVGPHLPLDAHFAIGNFIRDALAGGPIRITGDGTPFRSFLYAADLAEWLVTILLRGRPGRPYNVGSEEAMTIRALAERTSTVASTVLGIALPAVASRSIPRSGCLGQRYVPSCRRAHSELGLMTAVPIDAGISRTIRVGFGASLEGGEQRLFRS